MNTSNPYNPFAPGTPDGPPKEEGLAEKLGTFVGFVLIGGLLGSAFIGAIVTIWWGIAWLIVNMPGR